MYHCSKCKTLCQKHQGEWRAQCKCDIRCSPKWKPPPKPLSDKLTKEFSIGKAEPEPESIPIDNWLFMNNPKKETVKKPSKRAKATRVKATRVKATRVKATRVDAKKEKTTRVKSKSVHSSTALETESSILNKHKSKNRQRRMNKSKNKKKKTKKENPRNKYINNNI